MSSRSDRYSRRASGSAEVDAEAGEEVLSDADFKKSRHVIRRLAKVLLVLGPLLATGGLIFMVTVMSGRPTAPRFFLGGGMIAGGFLMTFFGVQAILISHAGKISRFMGRSTIPAASENIKQLSTDGRTGITNLAAAVAEGLAVSGGETGGEMILCPGCGSANDSEASFCDQCGNALARDCSGCGRRNDFDASFCNGCGARLS